MIAVKRGRPNLTNTLLGGGYDVHVDVQENVSLIYIDLYSFCAPLCGHRVE